MTSHSLISRAREWISLIPMLILLAGTYWLNQQVQPLLLDSTTQPRHDPDIIIDQLSAVTLNENGTPRFHLAADKVLHYADDDSTHLTAPRLNSLFPDKPSISSQAESGEISSNGEHIYLRDNVRAVRSATPRQSTLTFTTDYLHITPDLGTMETDRAVTLTDARNTIRAVGMKYDSNSQVVSLLSQVRSQHEIAQH